MARVGHRDLFLGGDGDDAISWNIDRGLARCPAHQDGRRLSVSSRTRWPHVVGEPYTATQAAEQLRCSLRWVKRLAETGRLPGAVKVGRDWAIPADVVERGLPTTGTSTPAIAGMYGVTAAAERLGLSVRYVQRLATGGQLAGACKQRGFWYIPTGAIEALLAKQSRH
jgi:excisionase family DNA binding protein